MLKTGLGLVAIAFIAILTGLSAQQGCRDLKKSWTHWSYYPIRDMRKSVAFMPQKGMPLAPDSLSVPTVGKDYVAEQGLMGIDLATQLAGTVVDVIGTSDSSVARGERKFQKTCLPCHGKTLVGDGPVATLFIPPPDLLAEPTRQRKDGYLLSYIRHGGVVMPSYGAQVGEAEAWDLVHYIRHLQRLSPR